MFVCVSDTSRNASAVFVYIRRRQGVHMAGAHSQLLLREIGRYLKGQTH